MKKLPREEKAFSSLFGKSIKNIRINKDDDILEFSTLCGETHYYLAEADCCSDGWFENFAQAKLLINLFITDSLILHCNCKHKATRQEDDKIKHLMLFGSGAHTWNNQPAMINFANLRNSSNGHYDSTICYLGNNLDQCEWAKDKISKQVFRNLE